MTRSRRTGIVLALLALGAAGCCSEKSGIKKVCLSITPEGTTTYVRDYEYERFRFFDIGLVGDQMVLNPGDTIVSFHLYQNTAMTQTALPMGSAYGNWLDTANSEPVIMRCKELSLWREYEFFETDFYLVFPQVLENVASKTLAYYMRVRKSDGSELEIGSLESDTLGLQLLKRNQTQPTDPLWDAEWKNVYDLGWRYIGWADLDLNISKGLLGNEENQANLDHQEGVSYLELLGLDVQNAYGEPNPDGKVDDNPDILDLDNGLLVFPDRLPFASDVLHDPVTEIYTANDEQTRQDASKYYISARYPKPRARQIPLGHVNIVPESEVVTFNGTQRLNRGHDYIIDYSLGIIELRDNATLDANTRLDICYKYEE